jgi:hypothetical protein
MADLSALGAAHGRDRLIAAPRWAVAFGRWRAADVRSILAGRPARLGDVCRGRFRWPSPAAARLCPPGRTRRVTTGSPAAASHSAEELPAQHVVRRLVDERLRPSLYGGVDLADQPDQARIAWTTALDLLTDLDHPDADTVHDKLRDLDPAIHNGGPGLPLVPCRPRR